MPNANILDNFQVIWSVINTHSLSPLQIFILKTFMLEDNVFKFVENKVAIKMVMLRIL